MEIWTTSHQKYKLALIRVDPAHGVCTSHFGSIQQCVIIWAVQVFIAVQFSMLVRVESLKTITCE